jgi:hypothetical protein
LLPLLPEFASIIVIVVVNFYDVVGFVGVEDCCAAPMEYLSNATFERAISLQKASQPTTTMTSGGSGSGRSHSLSAGSGKQCNN